MGILFYAVKATFEYRDLIIEKIVGRRLSGELYIPCIDCNNLRMEILSQKAQILGAKYLSTGHYAKVHKNDTLNCYQVFTANDMENDQSFLLSSLPQHNLSRLILPLSDLRKVDVIKINQRFGLGGKVLRDSKNFCYSDKNTSYLIEGFSHENLRPAGQLILSSNEHSLGEHEGIHKYVYGQSDIKGREGIGFQQIDRDLVVVDIAPQGKILLASKEDFYFEGCGVDDLFLTPLLDLTKPIKLFIRFRPSEKAYKAVLYFKCADKGVLYFAEKVFGLARGQHIVFYDRGGDGAKTIGSA
ncbi:MAG: hypothetical protein HQK53_14810, partial [Oligoflexia bacterium]|nr:hypothetical protein [Oligoflexia bacterium]